MGVPDTGQSRAQGAQATHDDGVWQRSDCPKVSEIRDGLRCIEPRLEDFSAHVYYMLA